MIKILLLFATNTANLRFSLRKRWHSRPGSRTKTYAARRFSIGSIFADALANFNSSACSLFKGWIKDVQAVAAAESALIFPVLLTMLLGTFDMGYGILAAQKTIRAAQVTADLITRHRSVTDQDIDEAIEGGRLSMTPYGTETYGVDIMSLEFDEDSNVISLWCETRNSEPSSQAIDNVTPLASPNEGIVVVTVRYDYIPTFSGFIFDQIQMQEMAYSRGRLTATVPHVDREGC